MRPESRLLADIYDAAQSLQKFTGEITREEFLGNDLIQTASFGKLIIIGEAVGGLSDELKIKYPQIPWAKIVQNRNVLAHAYFKIDWEVIWNTVTKHAIPLHQQIAEILKIEYPKNI